MKYMRHILHSIFILIMTTLFGISLVILTTDGDYTAFGVFLVLVMAIISPFYNKLYEIIGFRNIKGVTNGALYSAMVGALLMSILFYFGYTYSASMSLGNINWDWIFLLQIIFPLVIFLLSAIFCFILDINFVNKISNFRIAIASFVKYITAYLISFIVTIFVSFMAGGMF